MLNTTMIRTEIQQHESLPIVQSSRRNLLKTAIAGAGSLAALFAVYPSLAATGINPLTTTPANKPLSRSAEFKAYVPPAAQGTSPWGEQTHLEKPVRPTSVQPSLQDGLPESPRAYTEVLSYHAHVYFDEDTYYKAARLRQWVIERFPVELGNWILKPRGPHVTPSFYFGFTNDLLPVLIPWLQLNSLGLTILLHPNTDNPKADHLYYTLWVNRSQPVDGYRLPESVSAIGQQPEQIFPNIQPVKAIET